MAGNGLDIDESIIETGDEINQIWNAIEINKSSLSLLSDRDKLIIMQQLYENFIKKCSALVFRYYHFLYVNLINEDHKITVTAIANSIISRSDNVKREFMSYGIHLLQGTSFEGLGRPQVFPAAGS
jgi:hypothetical protein